MVLIQTRSLPHGIRYGREEDAEQLAQLFALTYQVSSHPCQDPQYVRASLQDPDDTWFVYMEGGKILACLGHKYYAWNHAYEIVRGITHPAYQSLGLATVLAQQSCDDACQRADGDLLFGFPRNRSMARILSHLVEPPLLPTGHDGGMNIANGVREYHLVSLAFPRDRRIRRLVPSHNTIAHSRWITEQLLRAFSFDTQTAAYPPAYIVGPASPQQARIGSSAFTYCYDPVDLSGALQITSLTDASADMAYIAQAFAQFLTRFPAAQHISAAVLVDKEALIGHMRRMGFAITAYLPAWYVLARQRYDCVLLVKRLFREEPVAHRTQEVVSAFTHKFSRFYV
jgi:hypothetical protein